MDIWGIAACGCTIGTIHNCHDIDELSNMINWLFDKSERVFAGTTQPELKRCIKHNMVPYKLAANRTDFGWFCALRSDAFA